MKSSNKSLKNSNNLSFKNLTYLTDFITKEKDLDDGTKILYAHLLNLADDQGNCYITNQDLAILCNVEIRAIQRRLKYLQEKGYLKREKKYSSSKHPRKIKLNKVKKSVDFDHDPDGNKKIKNKQQKIKTVTKKTSLKTIREKLEEYRKNKSKYSKNQLDHLVDDIKKSIKEITNKTSQKTLKNSLNSVLNETSKEVSKNAIHREEIAKKLPEKTPQKCHENHDENGFYIEHVYIRNKYSCSKNNIKEKYNKSPSEISCLKKKRKAQPAASRRPSPSAQPVVVFSSLEKLNLTSKTKVMISQNYSKQEVEIAVNRALAWKTRRCDEAAIRKVLASSNEWNDVNNKQLTSQKHEKILNYIQSLDGKTFNGYSLCVGHNYTEFSYGQNSLRLETHNPKFTDELYQTFEKLGLKGEKNPVGCFHIPQENTTNQLNF